MGRRAVNLGQIPDMSDAQKAWLAGFLDGEGHLAIQRTVRSLNGMSYYTPIVQVSQAGDAGVPLIREIHSQLGGIGLVKEYGPRAKAHRASACLMLWGAEARAICELILPFLRLKQRQAQAIIDWPMRQILSQGRRGTVMDAETAAKQEQIFNDVRALNAFRLTKNAEA